MLVQAVKQYRALKFTGTNYARVRKFIGKAISIAWSNGRHFQVFSWDCMGACHSTAVHPNTWVIKRRGVRDGLYHKLVFLPDQEFRAKYTEVAS